MGRWLQLEHGRFLPERALGPQGRAQGPQGRALGPQGRARGFLGWGWPCCSYIIITDNFCYLFTRMLNITLYGIPANLKKAILCEAGTIEKARIFAKLFT